MCLDIFVRPFVKRFVLCYQTVVCLSVLSVCLSVCLSCVVCNVGALGQTVGWVKMPLGTEVGLGPGDIVLDEAPSFPLKRGTAPTFRPMSIVAKWSPTSATAEHLLSNQTVV